MAILKNNGLLENARNLRREMTPHERKLWYLFLRKHPAKFYKQRIIGSYIVDFYCAAAKLIIELDGSQHYDADSQQKDAERTAYLENLGLQVVRFSNADINERFKQVCEAIQLHLQARIH